MTNEIEIVLNRKKKLNIKDKYILLHDGLEVGQYKNLASLSKVINVSSPTLVKYLKGKSSYQFGEYMIVKIGYFDYRVIAMLDKIRVLAMAKPEVQEILNILDKTYEDLARL